VGKTPIERSQPRISSQEKSCTKVEYTCISATMNKKKKKKNIEKRRGKNTNGIKEERN
jgi:hypothetical protein